jgi:hypothetical protein
MLTSIAKYLVIVTLSLFSTGCLLLWLAICVAMFQIMLMAEATLAAYSVLTAGVAPISAVLVIGFLWYRQSRRERCSSVR